MYYRSCYPRDGYRVGESSDNDGVRVIHKPFLAGWVHLLFMVACIPEFSERSQVIDVSKGMPHRQMSPLEQRGQPMQPANGSTTQTGELSQIAKEEKPKTATTKNKCLDIYRVRCLLGKPPAGAPIMFLCIFSKQ